MASQNHHFLLIACPAQGHINPTFQLAKCLSRAGPRVTFASTSNVIRSINIPSHLHRLSLAAFSTPTNPGATPEEFKRVVSKSIHDLIISLSNQGRPISLLIYTLMLPWAADVARDLHVPSVFFCIQSATTFALYTRYFDINNNNKSPSSSIKLPDLPLFESRDIPTFLLPSSPHYSIALPTFEDHIRVLERDPNPTVLVNSFDALEEHAIRAVNHHHDHPNIKMIAIGPLIPSGDLSYGCDLFESSRDYLSWLDSKADKSVVYVSFGTMAAVKKKFFEEILYGLGLTGRPFLWVIRPNTQIENVTDNDELVTEEMVQNGLGLIGGSETQGLIINWCAQVKVLSHQAIGCCLTHCGWNSTLESLVMGVPIVGVPLISDQPTNAKMVEEVWHVGVRAKTSEEGLVDREEVKRCVEVVMGGEEIKMNSKKWAELALEATKERGSSNVNLVHYLEDVQNSLLNEKIIKD